MQPTQNFDRLAETMGLSLYQKETLRGNYEKYDFSRLVKRGDVLYAPHAPRPGIFAALQRLFMGNLADLIGKNKTLLSGRRRIKFYAHGYHCVNIGQYKYYADPSGQAISRTIFRRAIGDNK